jgi:hypothetical protein
MLKFFISSIVFFSLWGCTTPQKSVLQGTSTSTTAQQPMKRLSPLVTGQMHSSAVQSVGATVVSDEPVQFSGIVSTHNYWRQRVNVPALSWSPMLAQVAQNWANELQRYGCGLRHSNQNQYGENLASTVNMPLTPAQVVNMWADERQFYNRSVHRCQAGKVCGHYTQVVWRDTREVGCGMAACGTTQVWVCNYSPAGNYVGSLPY